MVYDKLEQGFITYPNVKSRSVLKSESDLAVTVTHNTKKVTLSHRRIDGSGRWNLVPFSMSKKELQQYIHALQYVCNQMED